VIVTELLDYGWQREPVDAGMSWGSRGRSRRVRSLAIDVDAEASAVSRDVGEVEVVALAEILVLILGEDLGEIALELRVADIAELDGHEIAVHAQHGWDADGKMHVGTALLHAELQERIDAGHGTVILEVT
jgi:hypothetical protein